MPSSIEHLLSARTVAIVGASDRSPVHALALRNLRASPGATVVGVNPARSRVAGMPCFPSAGELPFVPDAALLLVGDERVEAAATDALEAGIRLLIVPGLAASAATRALRERLAGRVTAAGAVLLGPDCMGMLVPGRLHAWIGSVPASLRSGRLGIASQSGAIAEALVALGPRLGYRALLSLGSEGGFDVADACDLFARDPGTAAAGLFVETVRRPAALLAALRRLADADKPAVLLRVGDSRAAVAAAAAHTDGVPTDGHAFAALLRSGGALQARDYADFVETLAVLDSARRPRGVRIAAVTNSGGEAALLADAAQRAGIPFPPLRGDVADRLRAAMPTDRDLCNPVDAWLPTDTEGTYRRALAALAESGEFDVLVAQIDQTPDLGAFERDQAAILARAVVAVAAATDLVPVIVNAQSSAPVAEVAAVTDGSGAVELRGVGAAMRALASVGRWRGGDRAAAVSAPAPQPAGERPSSVAELLERYGFHGLNPRRVDVRWPVVRLVLRRDPAFGTFVALEGARGRTACALLPLGPVVAAEMVRDAGLAHLSAGARDAVAERLEALAELATAHVDVASAQIIQGLSQSGPVVVAARVDQA